LAAARRPAVEPPASLRDGAAAVDALASAMLTANPFFSRRRSFLFSLSGRRGRRWIYSSKVHAGADVGRLGNLTALLDGGAVPGYKANGTADVSVRVGAARLRVLAKTGGFGDDMADKVVSPALATPLLSQSWLNDEAPLGKFCPAGSPDYVVDVDALHFGGAAVAPWSTRVDHAKYVVAPGAPVACALDNNRGRTQFVRGGLAACLEDGALQEALLAGVARHDACP